MGIEDMTQAELLVEKTEENQTRTDLIVFP